MGNAFITNRTIETIINNSLTLRTGNVNSTYSGNTYTITFATSARIQMIYFVISKDVNLLMEMRNSTDMIYFIVNRQRFLMLICVLLVVFIVNIIITKTILNGTHIIHLH